MNVAAVRNGVEASNVAAAPNGQKPANATQVQPKTYLQPPVNRAVEGHLDARLRGKTRELRLYSAVGRIAAEDIKKFLVDETTNSELEGVKWAFARTEGIVHVTTRDERHR